MKAERIARMRSFYWACLIGLIAATGVWAQEYKLHVSNIKILKSVQKTWYGRPLENDFVVTWELYTVHENDKLQLADISTLSEYRIYLCQGDSTFKNSLVREQRVTGIDTALFDGNVVGPRYYARVEGVQAEGTIIHSDTAWAVSGKPEILAQMDTEENQREKSYKFPLFFPVAEILSSVFGRTNDTYANSTLWGKIAFTLIWYFFLFSLFYLLPFRCAPTLHLGRIFPYATANYIKAYLNKDRNFELYIAPRMRFVIEAWKLVMAKTNALVRHGGGKGLEQVDQICYDHFQSHGVHALEVLMKVIHFDPAKDKKKELEDQIRLYFGKDSEFGDLISKPYEIETRLGTMMLKWGEVKKDLFENDSRRMNDYPTVKILATGLENHITNGFNWQKVSAEVDRAIENRAASEIESLRGKSWVDWFWNLGAISPLLGLFGTVTGITKVFAQIMTLGKGTSHLDLVKQLSSGIFEALWTTIYGLMAGITLMMIYYLFKNNLEWIYNKWQSIFVHITEKL